jgi:hypothetical protein
MSALGHEQTSWPLLAMSALPLKADIHERGSHIRKGPLADIRTNGLEVELRGSFNPGPDFAAQRPKIDRFGEKCLSAAFQSFGFGLGIAIGGDHDDGDVRSCRFRLRQ